MDIDKAAEARSRMVGGFHEFASGLVDLVTLAFQDLAKTLGTIDWSGLAKLKADQQHHPLRQRNEADGPGGNRAGADPGL